MTSTSDICQLTALYFQSKKARTFLSSEEKSFIVTESKFQHQHASLSNKRIGVSAVVPRETTLDPSKVPINEKNTVSLSRENKSKDEQNSNNDGRTQNKNFDRNEDTSNTKKYMEARSENTSSEVCNVNDMRSRDDNNDVKSTEKNDDNNTKRGVIPHFRSRVKSLLRSAKSKSLSIFQKGMMAFSLLHVGILTYGCSRPRKAPVVTMKVGLIEHAHTLLQIVESAMTKHFMAELLLVDKYNRYWWHVPVELRGVKSFFAVVTWVENNEGQYTLCLKREFVQSEVIVRGEFDWLCVKIYEKLLNYAPVQRPQFDSCKNRKTFK